MSFDFRSVIESVGKLVDIGGVAVIVLGALFVTVVAARDVTRKPRPEEVYPSYRQGLGRAILLGLELLVAADIIRTVAVTPTLDSVIVLGVIVLVRTFLSFSLEVELEGRWPWQRARGGRGAANGGVPCSSTQRTESL